MVGGQLTITSATAAQAAPSGGDGVIQLDGGATLYKQDATTTTLGLGVLLDTSEIHVLAGKLIGRFEGSGELNVSSGATLGLAGSGVQLAPPAVGLSGGTIEVETGANVSLALPSAPALRHLGLLAGAALDVSIDNGSGPVDNAAAPDDLAKEIAIGSGATLSIDGGGGILGLSEGETLSGGGVLDGSLVNDAGTVRRTARFSSRATTRRQQAGRSRSICAVRAMAMHSRSTVPSASRGRCGSRRATRRRRARRRS